MRDTKYHVGDVVIVRSDLKKSETYCMENDAGGYAYITEHMLKRAGTEVVISDIDKIGEHSMYHIEGGSQSIFWTDGMFDGLARPAVEVDQDALMSILL